jgi:hypothetical protein
MFIDDSRRRKLLDEKVWSSSMKLEFNDKQGKK